MMRAIFWRVSGLTKGESLITRDTVFFDTSARRAMSLMVGRRLSVQIRGAPWGAVLVSAEAGTGDLWLGDCGARSR
jgi:hypothetical protein